MALLEVFPKLFCIVTLAFHIGQSVDSDTFEPEREKETLVICESSHNHIQCPNGKIKIKAAFYGRTDKQTCPNGPILDTNCKGTNAVDIIRNKCENKEECQLEASNSWFNDPCVGTYKYLHVEYECVKGFHPTPSEEIKTLVICESAQNDVNCPHGNIIVRNAFYGRTEKETCPNGPIIDTNCRTNALDIIRNKCENKKQCHLEASNSWFNDPCVGTFKYLHVEYKCVKGFHPSGEKRTLDICESNHNFIQCPHRTITIKNAYYGRTDRETCPNGPIIDTNCKTNAIDLIRKKCEDKEECDLEASNNWFNDPCVGTHKYLHVEYECVKGFHPTPSEEIKNLVICENAHNDVHCPNGKITVRNAFYGRTEKQTCPNGPIVDTNCRTNALHIIRNKCENKKDCHLEASNSWFNDPCVGTYKYLHMEYKCVKD